MSADHDRSETELVRSAADGDRDAFATLARQSAQAVYSLAYRLTWNKSDADDLAQEAFINAWRGLGKFDGRCSFGSWVYRITVNLWKNRVKYEKRRFFFSHFSLNAGRETDDGDEVQAQIAADDPDPLAAAEQKNETEEVQKILNCLEPEERAVILLRDIEDKSYEEIAALINCPLGTVKSRIARAREALRRVWVKRHGM